MKLEVTRDVIGDLYPLCRAGEASRDSQSLVKQYLAEDKEYAMKLTQSEQMPHSIPSIQLSPDAERLLLDDARERARLKLLLIGGSIALAGLLAIGALGMLFIRSGGF
ncbi:MAG: hypothetical protein KJ970_08095 [Candidatus Eisenbacteria bacterium]|uniref:Uncharacterized protein n=1 Tax=Eiseniibacteriota bacterium TaxID=2212470 RepID=A0A948WCF5_UNCEI|nr:hypothetical protein [Candidatus Eisenbacteria bacterium]MBU1947681.1 hypothetical protein [Candidatus Eisenbacteria bacterium]MBU2690878.1 hypothetical protein [Candidatus Eisenbacteria bacterium]